jgi:hypothetical protein
MTLNLTIYENEERYERELQENLAECRQEFAQVFSDNKNQLVSAAAPGKHHTLENLF